MRDSLTATMKTLQRREWEGEWEGGGEWEGEWEGGGEWEGEWEGGGEWEGEWGPHYFCHLLYLT